MRFLQALPLSIFVVYIKFIDPTMLENWKAPFIISGLAASIVMLIILHRKIEFNRILLAINLYLISGCLAFITNQLWLVEIYDRLRASGMMLWVIATGIIAVLFSPKGFIGIKSSDKDAIKKYSNYLILCAVIAFIVSFSMRGSLLFSELGPFTCLFLMQKSLQNKLTGK